MEKKIRFFDSENNRAITSTRDNGEDLKVGQIISPFNTPNGRVIWEVTYVELLDIETRDVYVRPRGYRKE